MVVCAYFQRGSCRYGADCRNEHIRADGQRVPTRATPSGGSGSTLFTRDSIEQDLAQELPVYILTCYAPGKGVDNLIKNCDLSPEELRLKYYQAKQQNNPALYPEDQLVNSSRQSIQNILRNLDQAYQFASSQLSSSAPQVSTSMAQQRSTGSAFGAGGTATFKPAQPATGNFGVFGSKPAAPAPAFGRSVFGAAVQQATSTAPAFGQSAFGSGGRSPFGVNQQPATSTGTTGFGAFASSTSTSGAFGANAAQPATASPYGSSPFSVKGAAGTQPAFGAAATQPAASFGQSTFGQSAFGTQNAAAPAFGQSAFGQTANAPPQGSAAPTTSAFGAGGASPFTVQQPASAPNQAPTAFAPSSFPSATNQTTSAFGQSAFGASSSAFGASAFGAKPAAAAAPSNPFGQAPAPANPFGAGTFGSTQARPAATSVFGSQGTAAMSSAVSNTDNPYAELDQDAPPRSEAEMAIWNADRFEWGKIPSNPPPVSAR